VPLASRIISWNISTTNSIVKAYFSASRMKILLIFAFSLTLFIKASAIDPNIFLKAPLNDDNSENSLCENLKDTINLEEGTGDILLARIDDNVKDSIIGDLSRCLGMDNPIILTDLNEPLHNDGLRKAKLIIIEGSDINMVCTIIPSPLDKKNRLLSCDWNLNF